MSVIGLIPPITDRGVSDHLLVDGGYVNNVPTKAMKQLFNPGVLITSSVQKLDAPLTQKLGDSVSGFSLLMKLLNPFKGSEEVVTQNTANMRVMCASRYVWRVGVRASIMRAESTVFEDSDLVIRPSINDVGSAAFGKYDDTEQLGYDEGIVRIRDWIQGIERDSPLYRALFVTPDMSDMTE